MSPRVFGILRSALLAWGTVSFVAVVTLISFAAYEFSTSNETHVDTATVQDVRHVLNSCNLGEDRAEIVIHSYISPRSFTGDHLDAYAIGLKGISATELPLPNAERPGGWYRGDQLPRLLIDEIKFVSAWTKNDFSWFPSEEELRSKDIYICPLYSIVLGVTPTEVKAIFIRPVDNMLFYFSGKT